MAEIDRLNPPILTPFVVSKLGFTYMGVKITSTNYKMILSHYDPLTEAVMQLINRWTKLSISLIGCINILKMTTLPTFLYLFQSIPLSPPLSFFQLLKKTLSDFIWNNKRPRLRLSLIFLDIYSMIVVGYNYQILYGISGQLKLEQVCFTLVGTVPQRGSQWNPSQL